MSRGGGRGGGRGGRGRSAPGAGQILIRETQIDLGMDKMGPDQVSTTCTDLKRQTTDDLNSERLHLQHVKKVADVVILQLSLRVLRK